MAKWKDIRINECSLEQAILTTDSQGLFDSVDHNFGHWLSDRIAQEKPLSPKWAASAYKMLQKYQKPLLKVKLRLLPWEAIATNYHEITPMRPLPLERRSEYRLELKNNHINAYSPYSDSDAINPAYISVGGKWDKIARVWVISISKSLALKKELENIKFFDKFEIDPTLEQIIDNQEVNDIERARLAAEKILDLVDAAKLDDVLPNGRSLYQHQKEGVSWLLAHRRGGFYSGGILADHMGLGKTSTALVAAKAMVKIEDCPVLVVCPVSLRDNWIREAEGVGVGIEVFSWAKLPLPLEHRKYLLICDEASYAQNEDSARTKAMLKLAQNENCLATWLLTGTPIKNGKPINLLPLLVATDHPLARDRFGYMQRYCNAYQKTIGSKSFCDMSGSSHLGELNHKIRDVILRRTKKDCVNLPEKIRTIKSAELTPKTVKVYNSKLKKLIASYRERLQLGLITDEGEALVMVNQLRQAGSIAKVEAAIAIAEEVLEQGEQIVIFTEFTYSAKAIHEAVGGELLTGATPKGDRQSIVDRFQSGRSKVFIGTIQAGGVGLTLTAANNVLLVDRPWTPGDAEQAEDRCHRIGQNQTVNSIWLQYGKIDEAIDQILESKQEQIDIILRGKSKTFKGGSLNELPRELLELL